MSEFWDYNFAYSFFRPWVDFCTRHSYRRIEFKGSLPDKGAVIFAPNHTNTLMDPLLVLQARKGGTLFGARADIFRKPFIARILHFLKIVPLARHSRDLPEEVARNKGTFDQIDRALSHGLPFCIFCEGTHRTMHSLLPVRRGIARIAFTSAEHRHTTIIPIGIDYSDWFHYRSCVKIQVGAPLDVNAFAKARTDLGIDELDAALQQELYSRLSELIFFLPDDENYSAGLARYQAAHPRGHRVRRVFQAILGFPLFLVCALLSLPMWALAEYLCSRIKDKAFCNTARFGVKLLGTPLFLVIWAILFFSLLPWWAALLLLLLFLPSYSVFYDWLNLVRR